MLHTCRECSPRKPRSRCWGSRSPRSTLNGLDSLLSIVQMPGGIPVATFAIGEAGAKNAGLFAVAILARRDPALASRLDQFRASQTEKVMGLKLPEPK